jgi:hypothetical protein
LTSRRYQGCKNLLADVKPKKMNQKVIAINEELVGNGSIKVLGGATEVEI